MMTLMERITPVVKLNLGFNIKIKFMGFRDACAHVKCDITVTKTAVTGVVANHSNENFLFENHVTVTNYISEINNAQNTQYTKC